MTVSATITAIPYGITSDSVNVSIKVSPRFQPPGPDAYDVPPSEVRQLVSFLSTDRFLFELGSESALPTVVIANPINATNLSADLAPDDALWAPFIGLSAESFLTPGKGRAIFFSQPTEVLWPFLFRIYSALSGQVGAMRVDSMRMLLQGIEWNGTERMDADRLTSRLALTVEDVVRPTEGESSVTDAFRLFELFHLPLRSDAKVSAIEATSEDLNSTIAMLDDFPSLRRKLGLVRDFRVPLSWFDRGIKDAAIRIRPPVPPPFDLLPLWTAVESRLDESANGVNWAFPRPRDRASCKYRYGLFRIRDGQVLVKQEATDLALAGVQVAANRGKEQDAIEATEGRRTTEPGLDQLQTEGIAVIQMDLDKELAMAARRQEELEAAMGSYFASAKRDANIVVYYEDLIRGVCMDVVRTASWHSLNARAVTYLLGEGVKAGNGNGFFGRDREEEGCQTVVPNTTRIKGLELHRHSDALCRWNDWWLSVRRVQSNDNGPEALRGNMSVRPSISDQELRKVQSEEIASIGPFRMVIREVAKTLVGQTFGETCQIRVRAVDLAGNALPGSRENVLTPIVNAVSVPAGKRINLSEYVTQPITIYRFEQVGAPEVLPKAAIGPGEDGAILVIRSFDARTESDKEAYLVPPAVKSAFLFRRCKMIRNIPRDQRAEYVDSRVNKVLPSPKSADYLAQLERLKVGNWPDTLRAPYLADPYCAGVQITLSNRFPESSVTVTVPPADSSGYGMPERSMTLRLRPGEYGASGKDHCITVCIPKGRDETILLASLVNAADAADFAAHDGFSAYARDASQFRVQLARSEAAIQLSTKGRNPQISPTRPVRLVHAVQRPNAPFRFGNPRIGGRRFGETAAWLVDDEFEVDAKSAVSVEFYPEWVELIDEPGTDDLREERKLGGSFKVDFSADEPNPLSQGFAIESPRSEGKPPRTIHELTDGRSAVVTYTAVGTSRFMEFFPKDLQLEKNSFVVKHRSLGLTVTNTRPPDPPTIADITFSAQRIRRDVQDTIELLVLPYLSIRFARDFGRSGPGERVGIVLMSDEQRKISAAASDKVSTWGFNPIKKGAPTTDYPLVEDFDFEQGQGETLFDFPFRDVQPSRGAERLLPGTLHRSGVNFFNVVLGKPLVDTSDALKQTRVWDLRINPGRAFLPFISLAFVRYQPNSEDGAHMSRVVTCDPVFLMPDRKFFVSPFPEFISVRMEGYSYSENIDGRLTSSVHVLVDALVTKLGREDESTPLARIELNARRVGSYKYSWEGKIILPSGRPSNKLRVMFWERMSFQQDADDGAGGGTVPIGPRHLMLNEVIFSIV